MTFWRSPLTGGRPNPRLKSYSASSGFVYRYFYRGYRARGGGFEYVFAVSGDRGPPADVSVLLRGKVLLTWTQTNRALSSAERYAISKLALFQAFDHWLEPGAARSKVQPGLDQVSVICAQLDLEGGL